MHDHAEEHRDEQDTLASAVYFRKT